MTGDYYRDYYTDFDLNSEYISDEVVKDSIGHHDQDTHPDDFLLGVGAGTRYSRQECKDLFISMSFQGKFLTWRNLSSDRWEKIDWNLIGPTYCPTDFGACCTFVPHSDFEPAKKNLSYEEKYHSLKADAQNGEINGLKLLLNVEQFNYATLKTLKGMDRVGFKIALHHHSERAMMQFSSQMVNIGAETQINLKPSLTYTADNAISRFYPEERGCYADGEANLTYLPYSSGYNYSLNNCLLDKLIGYIIWICRCIPAFIGLEVGERIGNETPLKFCKGQQLACANKIMKSIDSTSKSNNKSMEEAVESSEEIANMTKPTSFKCLPSCKVQDNVNQMSFVTYPQKQNFFHRQRFCIAASHVWQVTCNDEYRIFFMNLTQPNLCPTLSFFDEYFGITSSCRRWPDNFLENYESPNKTLVDEMFQYGRENLALVQIMIQSPYVTKIKRDVAMTYIDYIANTGGLLGLFLGFSFISGIEILFWICCCCVEIKKKVQYVRNY